MNERRLLRPSNWAFLSMLTVACGANTPVTAEPGTEATAFGINPAHTNAQPTDVVASPLHPFWIASLDGGTVSYPLVAGGQVIVALQAPDSSSQSTVVALSLVNGETKWAVPVPGRITIAYDNATVFVLRANGFLHALDATSGHVLWTTQLAGEVTCPEGQGVEALYFNSPPTAVNGLVYVNGLEEGGATFAISEMTGEIAWAACTFDGSEGTVAVDNGVVYDAEGCGQLYAFGADSGVQMWYYGTGCTGGGGAAPAVSGGLIWERDQSNGDIIVSSAGQFVHGYYATYMPALNDGVAFYTYGGSLTAFDINASNQKWIFSGDGSICTSAVVASYGQQVFVASELGSVYEIDGTTGVQKSVSELPMFPVTCSSETQSLAVAAGHLFVPAGTALIVY